MIFNELTEDNFLLFAMKNYENPQSVTKEDFHKDLNHFKYVKRLLKKYKNNETLKSHLIINHCIILYNIFGDAATPMFFYKLEDDLWPTIKTFIVFLNKLPEYPECYIHEIPLDKKCLDQLQNLTDGK